MNDEIELVDLDLDDIYTQSFTAQKKTIENTRAELEDILIDSLMDILRNSDKMDTKLKAVQSAIDLLGLKDAITKKVQKDGRPIEDDNEDYVKKSSIPEQSPEIQAALIKSLSGLGTVSQGEAKKINTQKGGHGA